MGASAVRTSFIECDLSRARFDGADARGAKLAVAQLNQASFAHAAVDAADFTRASLRHADFHRITCDKTIWTDADTFGATHTDEKRARAEDFVPTGG